MTDTPKPLEGTPRALVAALYSATFAIAWITGFELGRTTEHRRWRQWECSRHGATLVDTLCVRPDTSFRVPEPRGGA